jgi:hypothetical protein
MRKRGTYLPVLVFLIVGYLILFNGCTSPKDPGRYYNKDLGFSIRFPEGWEIEIYDQGNTITAICPVESGDDMFDETVSVTEIDFSEKVSLEDFHEQNIDIMGKTVDDFTIQDGGMVTFNNIRAKWIIFTYSNPHENVKVLGYSVLKGNRGYCITCDAEPSRFDDYYEILRSSAESFKFE